MTTQQKDSRIVKKSVGIFFILFSAIISCILAVTVDMDRLELGALINIYWPPFIGLLTVVLFLILTWITKNYLFRIAAVTVLCLYNLYVGFALHVEKIIGL